MTEIEAQEWLKSRFGSAIFGKLEQFVTLLTTEARVQNLVSQASLDEVWTRHIVDSAQLVDYDTARGCWVDVGSGAGLPGIVVALCREGPAFLVEPRRLRIDFLQHVSDVLNLNGQVQLRCCKVENMTMPSTASVISARAVAAVDGIFASAAHLCDTHTRWILPKGKGARSEIDTARKSWHGVFHVEPSVTSAESGIVIAHGVRRR